MKEISFTKQIKDELCSNEVDSNEARSIIAAFARLNGNISFSNKKTKLTLKTENANIAKYIYKLIKQEFKDVEISFSFLRVMKLYKSTQYLVNVLEGADDILEGLKIDFLDSKIDYELQNKEDKIRGYLVGLFLASGSCNNPNTSNYHLEVSVKDEKYAESIVKLINKTKLFQFKITTRRSQFVVYLKRSDKISDFLNYINANSSCLDFENIRIDRDFANSNNRLMNCDSYNYKKTLEISAKQIEYINVIEKYLGVDNLQNEKMKLLCKARLQNPEANYNELAEIISDELEQAVSKSNINHLFIRIKKMAEEFNARHN